MGGEKGRNEVGVVVHRRFHEKMAPDVGKGERCRVEVMKGVRRIQNEGNRAGK